MQSPPDGPVWVGIAGLLFAAACEQRERVEVGLDGHGFDYYLAYFVDARDEPSRVPDVNGVAEDGARFGPGRAYEAGPDEAGFVVVGLTREAVANLHPGFDPGREAEITALLEAPPTRSQMEMTGASASSRVPLPASARFFVTDESGLTSDLGTEHPSRARITLRVPVEEEWCGKGLELVPFGAEPNLLEEERARFVDAIRIDDDHVLVLGREYVALVERGGRIEPFGAEPAGPAPSLAFLPLTPDPWGAEAMMVDRRLRRDGGVTAWIVGDDAVRGPSVAEVAIRSDALIWHGLSRAPDTPVDAEPEAITLDRYGRTLVVGRPRLLMIRTSTSDPFLVVPPRGAEATESPVGAAPDPEGAAAKLSQALGSRDPNSPPHVLFRADGLVFRGDAFDDAWESSDLAWGGVALNFHRPSEAPDGELWVTRHSGIFRRPKGDLWSTVAPRAPLALTPCGSGILGGRGALATESHVYLLVDRCTAIIRFPRDAPELCAAVIPRSGVDVEIDADRYFTRVERFGSYLTFAGGHGALYELELEP